MGNSPQPPPSETDWLARLYRLADEVDLGLPPRTTATAIRAVVNDMYSARHRASVLANIAGGN